MPAHGGPGGAPDSNGRPPRLHAHGHRRHGGGTGPARSTLRFVDDRLEAAFRIYLFRSAIGSVRAGHILGIATWAVGALIFSAYTLEAPEVDLIVRFGVVIPISIVALIVTALPFYSRIWEAELVVFLLFNTIAWTVSITVIAGDPFDLGYVGVILIMAFAYTLPRLRFVS